VLKRAIVNFMTYYNKTARPINWTYTVEKLERKLAAHL
jgi:hypothetical protein